MVTYVSIVSSAHRNAATVPVRQCKCATVAHTLLHNEVWPLTPDNPQVFNAIHMVLPRIVARSSLPPLSLQKISGGAYSPRRILVLIDISVCSAV